MASFSGAWPEPELPVHEDIAPPPPRSVNGEFDFSEDGAQADAARLSLGRFRHLFASEVGMPFQRYVLWRRLIIAFDSLQGQDNVTAAAHAAGFADSAHFARTIKAMFGIRASDLLFAP